MELLFENEFLSIFLYQNKPKILKTVWTTDSHKMQDEDFKSIMKKWSELVQKHQAFATIVNTLKFQYTIVPAIQDWYNQEITPKNFNAGMRKIAFIVPEEVFSMVSIQQIFDDQKEIIFQYFENEDEAKKWLEI